MEFSQGYIKTQSRPDVHLHYVEADQVSDAPLVLLLHGFPEEWSAWKDYLRPLAKEGFHPVALDLRGYNQSSKPPGEQQYDLDLLVNDIKKVIEFFGKKTFLVGHDWGGIISQEFAAKFGEMCAGMVVINAPHRKALMKNMTLKQLLKLWYTAFFQLPKVPEKFVKRSHRKGLEYYRANFKGFLKRPMPKISTPTLVIWGEKDLALEKGIMQGVEEFYTQPVMKYFVKDATHWIHREHSHVVLELMIPFFRKIA